MVPRVPVWWSGHFSPPLAAQAIHLLSSANALGAGVVGEGVGATQQMGQYVLSGSGHAGQHTHLSQGAAQPQLELMHFVAQLELAAHRGLDAFQT